MRKLEKEEEEEKEKKKMGRSPCCDKERVKKGAWSPEEDKILVDYMKKNGLCTWRSLPKLAGLLRCGKSCRLRWMNYLRPNIKRGPFSSEEESCIIQLHSVLGNKWAAIASHIPGRTDNEVKNFWNTHLKKRIKPGHSQQPLALIESTNVKEESPPDHLMLQQWPKTPVFVDPFLCLWNSEVGEAFREACRSPLSQVSSSAKDESTSGVTVYSDPGRVLSSANTTGIQKQVEHMSSKDPELGGSDNSKSYELDGSTTNTTMQLLLDLPDDSEMDDFLQESVEDVSIYLQEPV